MRETIGGLLGWVFVAGGVVVLLAIVRFSIISPLLTRKSEGQLHKPSLAEVEVKWNVKLPAALETLYASKLVDSAEVYLAGPRADAEPAGTSINSFQLRSAISPSK